MASNQIMAFQGHERSFQIANDNGSANNTTTQHDHGRTSSLSKDLRIPDGPRSSRQQINNHGTSSRLSRLGNPIPSSSDKIWCTWWLARKECAFGESCGYRHEIPPDDPEVLEALHVPSLSWKAGSLRSSKFDVRRSYSSIDQGRRVDQKGNPPNATLCVGNLSSSISEFRIREKFGRYGSIISIDVQHHKRQTFITYESVADAVEARRRLNQQNVFGTGGIVIWFDDQIGPRTAGFSNTMHDHGSSRTMSNAINDLSCHDKPHLPRLLSTQVSPPRKNRPQERDSYRPARDEDKENN